MRRLVEPELMVGAAQTRAYANANFTVAHDAIMRQCFAHYPSLPRGSLIVDLGCGTGDIAIRVARRYSACQVHAFDGSPIMLDYAAHALRVAALAGRVSLERTVLPEVGALGRRHEQGYALIVSNSLLHHLHNPQVLWRTIRRLAAPGARVFIADLRRPPTVARARRLMLRNAANEPAILRRDFYNSLRAAFTVAEVKDQLRTSGLDLATEPLGDRHLLVVGEL